MMKPTLITIVVALTILGCGAVARVAEPAGVYDELTVEDYAAAEDHFAGEDVDGGVGGTKVRADLPAPNPFVTVYWNDVRCQELLIRRDGCLIAIGVIGTLTGTGGVAAALQKDDSKSVKQGIGYATLALAAAEGALTLAVSQMNDRFEKNCRKERPASEESAARDKEIDGGVQ